MQDLLLHDRQPFPVLGAWLLGEKDDPQAHVGEAGLASREHHRCLSKPRILLASDGMYMKSYDVHLKAWRCSTTETHSLATSPMRSSGGHQDAFGASHARTSTSTTVNAWTLRASLPHGRRSVSTKPRFRILALLGRRGTCHIGIGPMEMAHHPPLRRNLGRRYPGSFGAFGDLGHVSLPTAATAHGGSNLHGHVQAMWTDAIISAKGGTGTLALGNVGCFLSSVGNS